MCSREIAHFFLVFAKKSFRIYRHLGYSVLPPRPRGELDAAVRDDGMLVARHVSGSLMQIPIKVSNSKRPDNPAALNPQKMEMLIN